MNLPPDPIFTLERATRGLNEFMGQRSQPVFSRYPLIFSLLGAFGVASILYGFDAILEDIPLMHEHPIIPLTFGIALLVITGSLYKKLDKKVD